MPPALTKSLDLTSLLQGQIRRFFGWWLGELRDCLPGALTRALSPQRARIVARVGANALSFERDSKKLVGGVALDGFEPLPPLLARELAAAPPLTVMFPRHMVLCRTIELPLSIGRDLAAAMTFEAERHTPFLADQVFRASRIRSRDIARKTLSVDLAVLPIAFFDRVAAMAAKHGLALGSIAVDDLDGGLPPLEFSQHHHPQLARPWRREPWKLVAVLAAVLIVGALATLGWRTHQHAVSLLVDVSAQREVALRADALRSELVAIKKISNVLPEQALRPRAIEVVDALSGALGDDSWIYDLELSRTELRIYGFTADLSRLLERLQTAPILAAPELRSPANHDEAGKRDRFDIAFSLKSPAP